MLSISMALLCLICRVTGIASLLEYSEKIVDARKEEAPYMLPPLLDKRSGYELNVNLPHLSIDKMALAECLETAGVENKRLENGTPYELNQVDTAMPRNSWVDVSSTGMGHRDSSADLASNGNDNDSNNSSPGMTKKSLFLNEYNFDSMKRALAEPTEAAKRYHRDKQKETVKQFRDGNFEDLMRRTEPKVRLLNQFSNSY